MLRQLLLISGALTALILSACSTGTTARTLPLRFETLSVLKKSVLECDPKKPSMNISVNLGYAADTQNPQVSALVNQEILKTALLPSGEKSNVNISPDFSRSVENYIAEETKVYQETWTEIYNDWGHSERAENEITVRGSTRGFVGNAIVYGIEIDQNLGGAHPIHYEYFLNFDASTGKRLTLNDLFKPGYEAALTQLLTQKAMIAENVKTKSRLSCEPKPTENFILETDGMLFHFNPYDIAPYSRGAIRLKIRYDELAAQLKKSPASSK